MKRKISIVLGMVMVAMILFACGNGSATKQTKIGAPVSLKQCKGTDYRAVQQYFERAGFTNIVLEGEKANLISFGVKNGDVKSVTIGTTKKFEKDDAFYPDDMVKIVYYIKE